MTTVLAKDLYEFPNWNDTATCEDCGAEMDVPEMDDPNGDMKEPHWRREEAWEPFGDTYEALCDSCYAEAVSAILSEKADDLDGGPDR